MRAQRTHRASSVPKNSCCKGTRPLRMDSATLICKRGHRATVGHPAAGPGSPAHICNGSGSPLLRALHHSKPLLNACPRRRAAQRHVSVWPHPPVHWAQRWSAFGGRQGRTVTRVPMRARRDSRTAHRNACSAPPVCQRALEVVRVQYTCRVDGCGILGCRRHPALHVPRRRCRPRQPSAARPSSRAPATAVNPAATRGYGSRRAACDKRRACSPPIV